MINSPSESSTFRSEESPRLSLSGIGDDSPKAMAVRVPVELYSSCAPLIKGVGCPTWGQLAVWTCLDRPSEVMAQLDGALRRKPRVSRSLLKSVRPKTALTPYLTHEERGVIDVIVERYRPLYGASANRTAVFVAALRVASRHPDDYPGDGA